MLRMDVQYLISDSFSLIHISIVTLITLIIIIHFLHVEYFVQFINSIVF